MCVCVRACVRVYGYNCADSSLCSAAHRDSPLAVVCSLSAGSVLRESHLRRVRVEELKLPPIVDFAVENSRADNWDSVVTCHTGGGGLAARTWHLHHHCIGKHSLKSKFAADGAKPVVCIHQ